MAISEHVSNIKKYFVSLMKRVLYNYVCEGCCISTDLQNKIVRRFCQGKIDNFSHSRNLTFLSLGFVKLVFLFRNVQFKPF